MKAIAMLYLNYLELIIIGMVVATLGITLVAGIYAGTADGGQALFPSLIPVVLSATALIAITSIAIRRHKVLDEHPELKTKLFKEFRVLNFAFKNKRALVIVPILILVTLGATAYTDGLLKNQVIAEAGVNVDATFFNKSLIIDLIEISPENNGTPAKVTAVLRSPGYPDVRIENQEVGYKTTYTGRDRFIVRIVDIKNSSAKFFVERRND
jgi:hypothetical protein